MIYSRYFSSRLATLLALITFCSPVYAVVELTEFSSEQIRVRYLSLIDELRCPKCQNQNLAGSDSTVAMDLRREVLYMLEEGYSDTEIRTFMQERYGDFILYNPPMAGKTLLVWILPMVFLCLGLLAAFFIVRSAIRNAKLGVDDGFEPDDSGIDDLPPQDKSNDKEAGS